MSEDYKRKLCDMEDLNERIIVNKPWAQRLLATSLEITKKAVLNWCSTVIKIGETELDVDDYVAIFLQQITNLYEDLITDVDAIQEKSLDKIMKLLEQMQNLCRDLHVEIPTFNYEEVPLSELKKLILQRVEEYETLAEIRRTELRELHQKQLALCKRLGREPKFLSESPLPVPTEVDDLKMKIDALETEAMEREEKFFQLKEQISEIVDELQTSPSLDFEKEILSLPSNEVRITDYDMEQLQLFNKRLVKQLENVRDEISELRAKIDDLWDKLETDMAERDAFRQQNVGNSLETLKNLKVQVKKLEDKKKANIQAFITKQREELMELWEKCHCTQKERNSFTFFNSECFTEDLFELHDREISKWKKYYQDNQEIFVLLQEHQKLCNELKILELNSGGADRYKNRGCRLLVEEKNRNKLHKKIPKIEDNLVKLAETFCVHRGQHFRTFGQTIQEYIAKTHEDREKEFKLKLSAKKQEREQQALTSGCSRRNLFPPAGTSSYRPPTPCSGNKRKVFTPLTEPSKKIKSALENKHSKTGVPKINVSKVRRLSKKMEKKQRKRLSFKSSGSSNKENHDESGSTSYDDFEKEVSTKNNCRSTGYVVKDSNRLFKTPLVTIASPNGAIYPLESPQQIKPLK